MWSEDKTRDVCRSLAFLFCFCTCQRGPAALALRKVKSADSPPFYSEAQGQGSKRMSNHCRSQIPRSCLKQPSLCCFGLVPNPRKDTSENPERCPAPRQEYLNLDAPSKVEAKIVRRRQDPDFGFDLIGRHEASKHIRKRTGLISNWTVVSIRTGLGGWSLREGVAGLDASVTRLRLAVSAVCCPLSTRAKDARSPSNQS